MMHYVYVHALCMYGLSCPRECRGAENPQDSIYMHTRYTNTYIHTYMHACIHTPLREAAWKKNDKKKEPEADDDDEDSKGDKPVERYAIFVCVVCICVCMLCLCICLACFLYL